MEKTPFREDSLPELLGSSTLRLEMKNDIYSTYCLQVPPQLNGADRINQEFYFLVSSPAAAEQSGVSLFIFSEIKTTVVCPATQKHIKKYQRQESFLVEETEQDYESITLPYVQQQSFSLQVRTAPPSLSLFRFSPL